MPLLSTANLAAPENALRLMRSYESLKLQAYKGEADADGVVTIGYGHVLKAAEMASGKVRINGVDVQWIIRPDKEAKAEGTQDKYLPLTLKQAEDLYAQDIAVRLVRLRKHIPQVRTINDWGAWIVFFFNNEEAAAKTPGIRWRNGKHKESYEFWPKYHFSDGKPRRGLVRRRWSEVLLGNTGEVFRADCDQTEKQLQAKLKAIGFDFKMPANCLVKAKKK